MQHLINRQTIQLHLMRSDDAFQMQQLISDHYWNDLMPMMTSLFDELSTNEEVIRLDRLEVDLGQITLTEVRQARWNETLLSVIRKQLYEKIVDGYRKGSLVIRETKINSICRQWLFYIEKGYLPWNVLQIDDDWYDQVLEALAIDFDSVLELRKMIKSNPFIAHRLGLQYNDHFLVKFMEILTGNDQHELPRVIDTLSNIFLRVNERASTFKKTPIDKSAVWSLMIKTAAENEDQWHAEELMERILIQHLPASVIFGLHDDDIANESSIVQRVFKKLNNQNIRLTQEQGEMEKTTAATIDVEKISETKVSEQIEQEGVFVQNAGVVLVHPFLTSLFAHLQLTEGGIFKDKILQQKALFLIHYIATGRVTAEEHEMTLAKILCEWPLKMPIVKKAALSPDELAEAEAMLEAAIKQWSVLKNTTVDGLREGFLQRRGKLFTSNDQLHLRMETQSIDVLLDQLPWVLSMIKLPWMKDLLRVEWR